MSNALGNHILVEFMGCDPHIMNDVSSIERDMVDAALKAGATVINSTFHHFSPTVATTNHQNLCACPELEKQESEGTRSNKKVGVANLLSK